MQEFSAGAISVPSATPPDDSIPQTPLSVALTDGTVTSPLLDAGSPFHSDAGRLDARVKGKQKRNKPTLSCLECVERKTKCNRERPCLACIKRQSECEYTPVANLIASADRKTANTSGRARFVPKPSSKARKPNSTVPSLPGKSPLTNDNGWPRIEQRAHRNSLASSSSSPHLLSNVPYAKSSPSNVFGVGQQHPFSNYWTCSGGLPEVLRVMPSKEQADILIAQYFETVDGVYPFIHRRSFYVDYERFWAMTPDRKTETDASFTALLFAMYALGTQFVQYPSYAERLQTAEFYCSAANQALRVYSYLNRTSMRAIQAMLLMSYFLMNDNHASDAYAWAGIHLRQAYAMRLHRDPDIVAPNASPMEKQQRRKLWYAVFHHDIFLTVLLKLPPTATHSDVYAGSLLEENEANQDGLEMCCVGEQSRVENLMSINVIAPQPCEPVAPPAPHHVIDEATLKNDLLYQRCMWHLGDVVHESMSTPVALSQPMANSPRHKESLIAAFRRLYKSFPSHLTQLDHDILQQQAQTNPRGVRQNLFLTSNYFHCLMLLHASENAEAGVECNLKPALEAAHEAIWAFLKLWSFFEAEAGVWWVFQHRAFEESLLMAHLLATHPAARNGGANGGTAQEESHDPIFRKAREDIMRMLDMLGQYAGSLEVYKTRREVLQDALAKIAV